MSSYSIIVIEDQTMLRETLVHMLDGVELFRVAGHFGDAESALAFLASHDINVALIDYELPDMDGAAFLTKALVLRPALRGLFLSMYTTPSIIRRAFEAGAAGYLPKTVKTKELMDALLTVAQGEPYISPSLSRSLIGALVTGPAHGKKKAVSLTGEQVALLRLAGEGLTTTAIARERGITLAVTKHRFAAIYRILGACDRGEALIKAARMRLIE